jgi:hypothetical protein
VRWSWSKFFSELLLPSRRGLGGGLLVTLFVGLSLWLLIGLVVGMGLGQDFGLGSGLVLGLVVGPLIGLATGLRYGGRACLQHLLLRLELWDYDCMPRRYADFLNYAAERLFLRRVGGGYIFIHRLLQEYFLSLYTESGAVQTLRNARRRPWIAGCLSCNAAGIGQLYNGQPVKALLLYGLGWGYGWLPSCCCWSYRRRLGTS